MFEKPQSNDVLGLDIDAFSLKGVVIKQGRGKLKLYKSFDFSIEPIPQDSNVKPLYTSLEKEELETFAQNYLVVTAVNTQDILVRPLELKLKKDKDIEATLAFQVEPLLPYSIENAIVDKVLLSKNQEGSKLTVFCIRKDHLTQHIQQWNQLNIEPEVISAAPQALVLFANQFLKHETPFFLVHLGLKNSLAVLVDQEKLLAAQPIPLGLNQLIEVLSKEKDQDHAKAYLELVSTSFSLPSLEEMPALNTFLTDFRMTTTRILYSLAKQFKDKEIKDFIVTGPGAVINGLTKALFSTLNQTLIAPKEDVEFGASERDLLNYAMPIGEALSALPNSKDQVNFRQQEFLYPEPWKRLKQPISFYFLLCLGISIALFLFGNAYISYQEGELRQQYLHLLQTMNKPYTLFEKEFATKALNQTSAGETSDAATLTLEQIENRLQFLEKEIKATPQIYPLRANAPLVSDVLAWISSHPNFISKKQNEMKDSSGSMQIESFSYVMVKRPEPTKKQEKYQVKVEMEFSSPTPKMAREFHDALIAPNDMVDPKGEIKWNSNRDLYRTSFYLKDKTVYPTL